MSNISDMIEAFLLNAMNEGEQLNISRNELAQLFSVAPSQINYVLTTRFTPSRGYVTESRRGGGGSITVFRLTPNPQKTVKEILDLDISKGIDFQRACQYLERMQTDNLITKREKLLLAQALSDKALIAPTMNKDILRASILKNVTLPLCKQAGAQSGGQP